MTWWCQRDLHATCADHGYNQGVLCRCRCHVTDEPRKIADGQWAFTLPMTKPLSLNDRTHWRVKAKQVAEVREDTCKLVKAAKVPRMDRCRVTLIYEPRDARRRDPLNLVATLKAVQDGIVDARVVPDDTVTYMESPMPLIDAPIGGKHGKLWVLIEKVA